MPTIIKRGALFTVLQLDTESTMGKGTAGALAESLGFLLRDPITREPVTGQKLLEAMVRHPMVAVVAPASTEDNHDSRYVTERDGTIKLSPGGADKLVGYLVELRSIMQWVATHGHYIR